MSRTLPMQLQGGVFLIAAGSGLAIGALLGGDNLNKGVLIGGAIGLIGMVCFRGISRKRVGAPTKAHIIVMLSAILLEFASISLLFRFTGAAHFAQRERWLAILAVVSVHFVIMRWSHGPLMLFLALVVLVWLAVSFALGLSLSLNAIVYGSLLIAFGAMMAAPLLQRADNKLAV